MRSSLGIEAVEGQHGFLDATLFGEQRIIGEGLENLLLEIELGGEEAFAGRARLVECHATRGAHLGREGEVLHRIESDAQRGAVPRLQVVVGKEVGEAERHVRVRVGAGDVDARQRRLPVEVGRLEVAVGEEGAAQKVAPSRLLGKLGQRALRSLGLVLSAGNRGSAALVLGGARRQYAAIRPQGENDESERRSPVTSAIRSMFRAFNSAVRRATTGYEPARATERRKRVWTHDSSHDRPCANACRSGDEPKTRAFGVVSEEERSLLGEEGSGR